MRLKKEERKYEKVKTSEILDFLDKKIGHSNKECYMRSDYRDELEQRKPFSDMKRQIERMDGQLKLLTKDMDKMINHKHDEIGNVTIPVKKSIETGMYL